MLALEPEPPADAVIALAGMASVSGLALVPPAMRNPWVASSTGVGQVLREAAKRGARAIVLGVGGASLVAAWLDLEARIAAADLVITGEGRFDRASLEGKGPGYVLERGLKASKPVAVFAGRVEPGLRAPEGCRLYGISPESAPMDQALRECAQRLEKELKRAFSAL